MPLGPQTHILEGHLLGCGLFVAPVGLDGDFDAGTEDFRPPADDRGWSGRIGALHCGFLCSFVIVVAFTGVAALDFVFGRLIVAHIASQPASSIEVAYSTSISSLAAIS